MSAAVVALLWLGLVGLLVLALLAWLAGRAWVHAQSVSEPTVTNLTEGDASATLAANRLEVQFQQEYSETVAKGRVVRTDPAPGTTLRKGSTVTAWLSRGPERHAVPQLVGLTQTAATQALTAASLAVGTLTQVWSESVASGTVVTVSQNPGTLLKRGATVNLAVSKGRRPITIPSVTNTSATAAASRLRTLGFTVTVTTANSATAPKGQVISQTPASGTGHRGDTITLVQSLGPVMVQVPALKRQPVLTATATLTAAGFKVAVQYVSPVWFRLGLVSGQSPAGGGKAPQGSTVTLYVS